MTSGQCLELALSRIQSYQTSFSSIGLTHDHSDNLRLNGFISFFSQVSSLQAEQGNGGRGLASVSEKGCP
jgi:hypothetical protein